MTDIFGNPDPPEEEGGGKLDIDRALREHVQEAKLEAEEAEHRAKIDPENDEKARKAERARAAYEGLRDHLRKREAARDDGLPF